MLKRELPTPAVCIDLDILQSNIQNMAHMAKQNGLKLRPHIKTHKMPQIAKMQMEAGAVGVTCAKVSEAEVMAGSGIKDILIAYPIVGEHQIQRMLELTGECRIRAGFDSVYGAQKINQAAREKGVTLDLCMIINTGLNRDGVLPGQEAAALAAAVRGLTHVRVYGILTHEGHVNQSKNVEELTDLALAAGRKMRETADLLRKQGVPIEEISMGSTPVCRAGIAAEGVTECRPGTYVFNDVHETLLFTPAEECALTILATVVSHPAKERYIVDAGSKTLTSDKSLTNGYGLIREAPDAVIARLSEEHGVVEANERFKLNLGDRIEIIPNHVCPTVNLASSVYMTRRNEVIDRWEVAARGHNV